MTHFKIIGIRPLTPEYTEACPELEYHVRAIQKALWGKNQWYYFYQGYSIDENNEYIELTNEAYNDFSFYDTENLKVSVSAIVGKNGSGKSSIVDLLIRMINNLSATLLGERFNFAAAEHLHFIDYVYAELAIRIRNSIYVLEERGREIKLHKYLKTRTSGKRFLKVQEASEMLLSDPITPETTNNLLKRHPKGRNILRSLFYTLVCNYSLYGFNYRDYAIEATPISRLKKLYRKKGQIVTDSLTEDHIWLKGIFHKNDGYQTPIVLHPMREDGFLNVEKENYLAKERMGNLLFYKDAQGNYPQRIINGNLHIIAFGLTPTENKKFSRANMLKHIGIGKQQNIYLSFDKIYDWIIKFWDSKYHFMNLNNTDKLWEDASDYIVYKTLKIVSNYKKYHPIYNYLSKKAASYDELCKKLTPLYDDFTHITKKLLRTIMYLKYNLYDKERKIYNLRDIDEFIMAHMGESIHKKYKLQSIDLLPPPIFNQKLYLQKEGHNSVINFSNLSSGEKQIAYTISNFMYHLVNVDSEWNDYYRDSAHLQVIKYRYVNVVFDEVELYLHPELQRNFMGLLLQALRNAQFKNLRGINIILATHSPFILSDIPHSNVLCLGEESQSVTGTFGANIIEMLGNNFYLSSVIGNVASQELSKLVSLYYMAKAGEDVHKKFMHNRNRFKYLLEYISDPYLKSMAERMYNVIIKKI